MNIMHFFGLLILLSISTISINDVFATSFSTNVIVTPTSQNSEFVAQLDEHPFRRSVVTDDDKLYLIFVDGNSLQEKLYFAKYDGTMQTPILLDQVVSGFNYRHWVSTLFVNNGVIDVVFSKEVGGGTNPQQFYHIRSTDDGNTFGMPHLIANAQFIQPMLFVNGNNITLYYSTSSGENSHIIKSTNAGVNWSIPVQITTPTITADNNLISDLVFVGNTVHLIHTGRDSGGIFHLYYTKSTDNGNSWISSVEISDLSGNEQVFLGKIFVNENDPTKLTIVMGMVNNALQTSYIQTSFSNNSGATWSTPSIVFDNTICKNVHAMMNYGDSINVGNRIYGICIGNPFGEKGLYQTISSDLGATWSPLTEIGTPDTITSTTRNQKITAFGSNIHYLFTQEPDAGGSTRFIHAESNDSGASLSTINFLSDNAIIDGNQLVPLLVSDNSLWIIFKDTGSVNPDDLQFYTSEIFSSTLDSDNDGLTDIEESSYGTNPNIPDTDGDALLDGWEVKGIDGDDDGFIDFQLDDANPLRSDVYVEYDYMIGLEPNPVALILVQESFANSPFENFDGTTGITLHIDSDPEEIPFDNEWVFNADRTWPDFFESKNSFFMNEDLRTHENSAEIRTAKLKAYHYATFINAQNDTASTGKGFISSNNFVVSLGLFRNLDFNTVAGTFMHELGHNLGLRHGGPDDISTIDDEINCKPNYLSVMSYTRQTPWPLMVTSPGTFLTTDTHYLDYSHSILNTLNEFSLSELIGISESTPLSLFTIIGSPDRVVQTGNPIDWNNDSIISGLVSQDINDISIVNCEAQNTPNQELISHDDWSNLTFNFSSSDGQASLGFETEPELTVDEIQIVKDIATEDNTPPILSPIGNKAVDELIELSFTASAVDMNIPSQTLFYSVFNKPIDAEMNYTTGVFSWTPTEEQGPGVYTFDISATDGIIDSIETITVTINEINTSPVLTPIGDKSVNEGTELSFTATAIDSDIPVNSLSFSLTGAPVGASINTQSGVFTWTPTESQTTTFDVIVFDGTLFDSETITITVNEVTPSSITLNPDEDSFIRSGASDTNEGSNDILRIQGSGSNRILIGFDQTTLYEIIEDYPLDSAILRLYIEHNGNNWGSNGRTVDLHRIQEPWDEGNGWNVGNNIRGDGSGVTWKCAADANISNQATDCNSTWVGGSFVATPTDTVLVVNGMINQYIEFDVTDDVLSFLDGSNQNHGWIIKKTQDGASGHIEVVSREGVSFLPELKLTFD